jgi:hypothetical protein
LFNANSTIFQLYHSENKLIHDQFIRKQAVEMETMENPDGNLDPEDFEYYEFQGTIKT